MQPHICLLSRSVRTKRSQHFLLCTTAHFTASNKYVNVWRKTFRRPWKLWQTDKFLKNRQTVDSCHGIILAGMRRRVAKRDPSAVTWFWATWCTARVCTSLITRTQRPAFMSKICTVLSEPAARTMSVHLHRTHARYTPVPWKVLSAL